MDNLYYQPSHLWKGQKAIKKLRNLSKEKPKVIKQWQSKQAFWQVHLRPLKALTTDCQSIKRQPSMQPLMCCFLPMAQI